MFRSDEIIIFAFPPTRHHTSFTNLTFDLIKNYIIIIIIIICRGFGIGKDFRFRAFDILHIED